MNKNKYYYKDGGTLHYWDWKRIVHRIDGPAIELADGEKRWFIDGECHREYGPAIESADGEKKWYLNGKRIKFLSKKALLKYMELNNLTIAHLLTDPDPIVKKSADKCKW